MTENTPPHIMLDLETFGNGNDAAIVSIGAVKFDADSILDEFHVGVDPESCQALGLKIDAGTIMWWMDPGRDAARVALLNLERVDLPSALIGFTEWAGNDVASIWGNGATSDNVILRSAYAACRMQYPVKFWQDQCYRTMKYRAPGVALVREGTHHDALDDARCQAKHLQMIMKQIGPRALLDHLGEMQDVMRRFLDPEGDIEEPDFINRMIEFLDGPLQRERMGAASEIYL